LDLQHSHALKVIHTRFGFDFKGIWIWSKPLQLSDDTDLIILDTEGLNSVQRAASVDAKIFALSLLLSSYFIYNS